MLTPRSAGRDAPEPEELWREIEKKVRSTHLNLPQAMRPALLGWARRAGVTRGRAGGARGEREIVRVLEPRDNEARNDEAIVGDFRQHVTEGCHGAVMNLDSFEQPSDFVGFRSRMSQVIDLR